MRVDAASAASDWYRSAFSVGRAGGAAVASQAGRNSGAEAGNVASGTGELSEAESRQVEKLARTDREVRAHEQRHIAAGSGVVTGGPSFSYTTGPDGRRYAVGGEVSIDASPGRTPEETLVKAQQIRRAALAPADPSGQDRQVAAAAARMEIEARQALAEKAREGNTADGGDAGVGLYRQVEASGNPAASRRVDAFA